MLNGDGQETHMWKYLKTVDFINTKIIMFQINLFQPLPKNMDEEY